MLPVLAVSPTYHHVDADLSAPDNTGLSGGRIAFYTSYGFGATPVSVEADGGWGNNGGAGGAGGQVELRFPHGDLTLTDVTANGGPAMGIPAQGAGGMGGVGGSILVQGSKMDFSDFEANGGYGGQGASGTQSSVNGGTGGEAAQAA